MIYFNLKCSDLALPEFSDNAKLATWVRLMAYCCEQENGGLIANAKDWTARQWMICTGVDIADLQGESPLWHFTAVGALSVDHYPIQHEEAFKRKRRIGRESAEKRWQQKQGVSPGKNGYPLGDPIRKGKKYKESTGSKPTITSSSEGVSNVVEFPDDAAEA